MSPLVSFGGQARQTEQHGNKLCREVAALRLRWHFPVTELPVARDPLSQFVWGTVGVGGGGGGGKKKKKKKAYGAKRYNHQFRIDVLVYTL